MNAAGFPLLSLLTFLPLIGAAVILSVRGDEEVVARNARWTALWTSLAVEASRGAVRIQTGRVANYAFAMIIGLVVFISLFLIGR